MQEVGLSLTLQQLTLKVAKIYSNQTYSISKWNTWGRVNGFGSNTMDFKYSFNI
jgi:hypothetical protein